MSRMASCAPHEGRIHAISPGYGSLAGWWSFLSFTCLVILPSVDSFLIKFTQSWHTQPLDRLRPPSPLQALTEPKDSQFGRQDYWNQLYESQSNFSWYAGWEDLQPFVEEFLGSPESHRGTCQPHVLLPGVGNDAMLVDMFEAGYTNLTAMDYAPEGIARCREMLDSSQVRGVSEVTIDGVSLVVEDARDLKEAFTTGCFQGVIEKGTLDAIFLSGGNDKELAQHNLDLAISELARCVEPGGLWISIAAVVDDRIETSFEKRDEWTCLVKKDDLFITQDGFASNNIDGSLLVWRKAS